MLDRVLQFYHFAMANPGTVAAAGMVLIAALYVIAAVGFALWADREERRREDQRARFDRIMRANEPPRHWPPKPGAKGFYRRGGRAAS